MGRCISSLNNSKRYNASIINGWTQSQKCNSESFNSFKMFLFLLGCFRYGVWWTMTPASIIVGLCAAPLWTAQCSYFTVEAKRYAVLSGSSEHFYFDLVLWDLLLHNAIKASCQCIWLSDPLWKKFHSKKNQRTVPSDVTTPHLQFKRSLRPEFSLFLWHFFSLYKMLHRYCGGISNLIHHSGPNCGQWIRNRSNGRNPQVLWSQWLSKQQHQQSKPGTTWLYFGEL